MLISLPFPNRNRYTEFSEDDKKADKDAEAAIDKAEQDIQDRQEDLNKASQERYKNLEYDVPPGMAFEPATFATSLGSLLSGAQPKMAPPLVINIDNSQAIARREAEEKAKGKLTEATATRDKLIQTQGMHEERPGNGAWGVSHRMCWHSGVHVSASAQATKIRAIADGVLIYKRESELPKHDKDDSPLRYHGQTDNGCVVLRHTVDIGEGANAEQITFYSITMHLASLGLVKDPANGAEYVPGEIVPRNTELGMPGHLYGQSYQTHFELICDTENLKKLIGRAPGSKLDTSKNGRTDAIYGNTYFYIKAGAEIFDRKDIREESHIIKEGETPESVAAKYGVALSDLMSWKDNPGNFKKIEGEEKYDWSNNVKITSGRDKGKIKPDIKLTILIKPQHVSTTTQDLVVSMRFQGGKCLMTTYQEVPPKSGDWLPLSEDRKVLWNGETIPAGATVENGSEYSLYNDAEFIVGKLSKESRQSISAVYELLRFGRVVGPDPLLEPIKHLREIVYEKDKSGIINLNNPGRIMVFSDADFPEFQGWSFIQDDCTDKNSLCDSPTVLKWLDEAGEAPISASLNNAQKLLARESRLDVPYFMRRIGRAFLRIPADWDEATIDERWSWLKTDKALEVGLRAPMTAENYEKLKKHNKQMAFWEQAKKSNNSANAKINQLKTEYEEYNDTIRQRLELERAYQEEQLEYRRLKKEYDAKKITYNQAKSDYDKMVAEAKAKNQPLPESVTAPEAPDEPKKPTAPTSAQRQGYPKEPLLPPASPQDFTINPSDCWHLPPRMFIEHMRKCMWLDRVELARIYPDDKYKDLIAGYMKNGVFNSGALTNDIPNGTRERHRNVLNKLMQKYLVTTLTRMAHFLGQGAHESAFFAKMIEGATGFYYESLRPETNGWYNNTDNHYYTSPGLNYGNKLGNNGAEDAIKFRGRGMKQLTGKSNYAEYWCYRGWLKPGRDFDSHWWDNDKKRAAIINDPEKVGNDPYITIDASAWYWTAGSTKNKSLSINNKINEGDVSDSTIEIVSLRINAVADGLPNRITQTQRIYNIIKE